MPDMPNYKEFEGATQESGKDATEIFDQRYGRYVDQQGKNVSDVAKPYDTATPFKLGG